MVVAVGIITADCVPVLLRDRRGRAVAAVHAGWRGAAAGLLEATLDTLARTAGVEPRDVEATIGPAASGCCYEVGTDVWEALRHRAAVAFTPRTDRHMLDLRAAVRMLAEAAGVAETHVLGPCTICDRRYASYRRDAAAAGRQLSFIALT
jgi:YfiH family protein